MLFEKEAIIHYESGIHARVAAMIVQKSHELYEKFACKIYLRSEHSQRVEMRSLMMLIALKINNGDSVFVSAEGENREEAVLAMVMFLEGDFMVQTPSELHEVDRLLHENALMQERLQLILEAVQDGICVVDKTDCP